METFSFNFHPIIDYFSEHLGFHNCTIYNFYEPFYIIRPRV